MLNHRRCMLRGDADQSLGQRGFGLYLCVRIILFFGLREFRCIQSDDEADFPCICMTYWTPC